MGCYTMKKISAIIIIFFILFIVFNTCIVQATIDPDNYKPTISNSPTTVNNMVSSITGTLSIIGTIVSVLTLAIMGIKYMVGSVEEKAEYKKTMIPYIIGAVMIFAITTVLNTIVKLVNQVTY